MYYSAIKVIERYQEEHLKAIKFANYEYAAKLRNKFENPNEGIEAYVRSLIQKHKFN